MSCSGSITSPTSSTLRWASGDYDDPGRANHAFDAHYTTNGGSVLFVQSTGTTIKISAYDDADGNNLVQDGAMEPITGITLSYAGGTV